jgi:hypothetical protein
MVVAVFQDVQGLLSIPKFECFAEKALLPLLLISVAVLTESE